MDYHERLKKLGFYSLKRKRERFLIRCIRSTTIPTTLDSRYRTVIHHSTARQMERLFNTLPYRLQNIRGVKTGTFKRHLDRWLRDIPDTPKIDNYGASVSAATNSITNQMKNKW